MSKYPNWTQEEKDYLQENLGRKSVRAIARHLGRSVCAINNMKARMHLGATLDNGDYITACAFFQTLCGSYSGMYYKYAYSWPDFPFRKMTVDRCSFKVVYLDEFWEWAETHRRLIDFSKLEENALGKEPDWVKTKRSIDFKCRTKTTPWTPYEDNILRTMLKEYKYTYFDIAMRLNRTEGAVKRRFHNLDIKERPLKAEVRPWTEEEVQKLVFMYNDGWSFEQIGMQLGRTGLCCQGRLERVYNPDMMKRIHHREGVNYVRKSEW